MIKFPLTQGIMKWPEIATNLNEILNVLFWISPVLNASCGQVEPPAQYLRDGFLAFADGSNWDPNSEGKGYYYYDLDTTSWVKTSA